MKEDAGPRVEAVIADVDNAIGSDAQVVVYRILQEALTNVRKHAHATRISLRVRRKEDRIVAVVEDDGRGFDVASVGRMEEHTAGLGLTTMAERTRMLGGSARIESEIGKGTKVFIDLPISTHGGGP